MLKHHWLKSQYLRVDDSVVLIRVVCCTCFCDSEVFNCSSRKQMRAHVIRFAPWDYAGMMAAMEEVAESPFAVAPEEVAAPSAYSAEGGFEVHPFLVPSKESIVNI